MLRPKKVTTLMKNQQTRTTTQMTLPGDYYLYILYEILKQLYSLN